jgi:aspartate kinase
MQEDANVPETPVLKFGGSSVQGAERFGLHEDRLLDQCHRMGTLSDIYLLLAQRRNNARAHRLKQVARDFILPLRAEGKVPVVVVSAFDKATDKLEHLAAAISDDPNSREFARLLMSGELRANSSLAMALEDLGCPARSMTGREAGIVTQGGPVDALVDRVDDAHEVSILGRGGSNLTAVALAAALGEDCCTMLTDVCGVFDCDPRENEEACQLDEIAAEELLTWDPLPRVIQREAVEFACERGVDIWIRSAFDPEACGTIIRCR